jgi:ubiquitin-protein ligase
VSPRERRLTADYHELCELEQTGAISLTCSGSPPDRYVIRFSAAGLAPAPAGPVARDEHEVAVYLHLDYPRRPPVVTWRTPVFHPNLLGPERHGGVCLGSWSPGEGLADMVRRLVALAGWRAFGLMDALNTEAAAWAQARNVAPGTDVQREVAAHA